MKTHLAVLFGGRSCEHDVSIVTGMQVMDNADETKYEIIPIYIARDGRWFTGSKLRDLDAIRNFDEKKFTPCKLSPGTHGTLERPVSAGFFKRDPIISQIDIAFPAFHGLNGEDGTIQGLFELCDIPYVGPSVVGAAAGMDKIVMKSIFRGCGLPVLPMAWFDVDEWNKGPHDICKRIEEDIGFPVFIKPANLGSSIGISKANDIQSLKDAVELALAYDRRVLVEQGLEKPTEVNCSAIGYGGNAEASLCEMPIGWEEFLTFEDKYTRGSKGTKGMESLSRRIPAPIDPLLTSRIEQMTLDIFRILDLRGVARVDYMLDADNTLYVNEVNTIPGSMAFYLWEGKALPFNRLIDKLVDIAQKSYADKQKLKYSFDSTLLANLGKGAKGAKGSKN
jgi:D-alanine-D-alanine ligase